MKLIRVFISSVQSEFAEERVRLREYISGDPMLSLYFKPFIFEKTPAEDAAAKDVYIREAAEADVYIGLLGERYGYEDEDGVSPTEREYDAATENKRYRLVFLKEVRGKRHAKMSRFIAKVEKDVVRGSFVDYEELQQAVYAALVQYMQRQEILRLMPFDATPRDEATMDDIDAGAVSNFVRLARGKRGLPFSERADVGEVLSRLRLRDERGRLTNAALLLFGKKPQRFVVASEVKCAQFYGTEVEKPIPFYQVFQGNVFELIDQAVAFVMSHVDARVGTRERSTSVDVDYEIPLFAVREAIVNAVAHRDYRSTASVQVMLFRDRLEVWSPGRLPDELSVESLSRAHHSIPVNHLLAEPIYLAGYIERMGTGTSEIIRSCVRKGLREPQFKQSECFRVVIWRKNMAEAPRSDAPEDEGIMLTDRQIRIMNKLRDNPMLTTDKLAALFKVKPRTISRDLYILNKNGYLLYSGSSRKGVWTVLK